MRQYLSFLVVLLAPFVVPGCPTENESCQNLTFFRGKWWANAHDLPVEVSDASMLVDPSTVTFEFDMASGERQVATFWIIGQDSSDTAGQ